MAIERRNSNSSLFNNVDKIINLFIDEINKDEKIKRYLTFLTKEPLENYSVDNDGTKIYQYDIPERVDEKFKYCISKNTDINKQYRNSNQILYPYPYQFEKVNEDRPTIFVYHDYSSCNSIITSSCYCISILVPCEYLEIEPYGESRIHKIMERVAYLFNNVGLDKESQLELGDIKFQVKGRVEEGRINKTNYISIVTIPIETKYINSRTIDASIGY